MGRRTIWLHDELEARLDLEARHQGKTFSATVAYLVTLGLDLLESRSTGTGRGS